MPEENQRIFSSNPLISSDKGISRATTYRIAFVVVRMGVGGKERVILHLAHYIKKRGAKPIVVCLTDKGEFGKRLEAQGVQVEAIRSSRRWDLAAVWRLAKLFRRFKPDLINVHDRSSLPYVFLANQMSAKCPIVFSCHGLLFQEKNRSRYLEQLAIRNVRVVSAVSEQVASEYSKLLRWNKKVEIIPNGVPPISRHPNLRSILRAKMGLSEDVLVLLAVGNINPEKGYEDLLEAVSLVREEDICQRFVVLVAGSKSNDTYWQALCEHMKRLNLTDKVRFLGCRNDTEALYSAADIFILPSRKEGLPMVLLEAMSAGLPIIATDVGGVSEAIRDGESGLLIPPESPQVMAKAMIKLANDKSMRDSLSQAARARFEERYDISRMVNQYDRLFRDIIGLG